MSDQIPGSGDSNADRLSPQLAAALANEQFGLQAVSGATISESSSRAMLFFSTLSSGLVAIGFASAHPASFAALLFTALPTVFILGCFTIVRLVDTSVENLVALRRMELIREYWASLDPRAERFFERNRPTTGQQGVRYGFWSMLFTMASMIVIVNAVVAGAVVTMLLVIAVQLAGTPAVVVGLVVGLIVAVIGIGYEHRRLDPHIREPGADSTTAA